MLMALTKINNSPFLNYGELSSFKTKNIFSVNKMNKEHKNLMKECRVSKEPIKNSNSYELDDNESNYEFGK